MSRRGVLWHLARRFTGRGREDAVGISILLSEWSFSLHPTCVILGHREFLEDRLLNGFLSFHDFGQCVIFKVGIIDVVLYSTVLSSPCSISTLH